MDRYRTIAHGSFQRLTVFGAVHQTVIKKAEYISAVSITNLTNYKGQEVAKWSILDGYDLHVTN